MVGRRFLSLFLCVFCLCMLSGSVVLAQGNEDAAPAPPENEEIMAEPIPVAESLTQILPEQPLVSTPLQAPPAMSTGRLPSPMDLGQTEASNKLEETQSEAMEKAPQKTLEWVWGEVVEVAPEKKEIVIKHLDYETYEEVQMKLLVIDKTTFENVSQLSDIRLKDRITVDYYAKDGANICELIVVEKDSASKIGEDANPPAVATELKEDGLPAVTEVADVASVVIPDSPQNPDMGAAPSGVMNFTQKPQGTFGQMPDEFTLAPEVSMGGILNETQQ